MAVRRARVVWRLVVALMAVVGAAGVVLAVGPGGAARPGVGGDLVLATPWETARDPAGPSGDGLGAAPEAALVPDGAPAAGTSRPAPPGGPVAPDVVSRALVRSAHLTVEVADPGAAVRAVRLAAATQDAVVAEEQADETGGYLVLRVPVDGLDRLADAVAGTGTVLSRGGRIEDVTGQVVDLDARLASREASVARVRGLLAEAASIGDVVAVESELARREADLDALRAQLVVLREQVALATLTVELRAAPVPEEGGDGFTGGLAAGWAGLRGLVGGLAAAAGFALPFLPVALPAAGALWALRRSRLRPGGRGGDGRARDGRGRSGPGSDGES